ncbi:hypothetical protein C1J03_08415 [Sulfitobacter sp. SK012]|uniref:hypothetical protein n=1 Tax=Sulfitobacter sp. SK012 TaxID=1389005 RepID=UPI000E0AAB03|nr:hypothetical protein [Sulfitobacter sp. SK012]AXI46035.1 hypothetical protein C1J03_08415 [Sulfitobacter sp. SK012]
MITPLQYHTQARNVLTAVVVCGVWAALLAAYVLVGAAWWVIAFFGIFTLPALYDLAANPAAGLTLDQQSIRWYSGRAKAEVALSEIDHIRLDTRLDFSTRATVILHTGRKVRLPFEATPPARLLEPALDAHDIPTRRHHFTFMQ